jgi:hypothetical protein
MRVWALEPVAALQPQSAGTSAPARKAVSPAVATQPLAWIDRPATQWPQVVLGNELTLTDRHVTGLTSFLVQTEDGVRALSSVALLDPRLPLRQRIPIGGFPPPANPTPLEILKTKMLTWTMKGPAAKTILNVETVQGWKVDKGRHAVALILKPTSKYPTALLKVRVTPPKLGERVYIVACASGDPNCAQAVYPGTIENEKSSNNGPVDEFGVKVAEGTPEIFGAPVIDDAGFVVGVTSSGTWLAMTPTSVTCIPVGIVLSIH